MQYLFCYPFVLSAFRVSVWKEHWTSGAVLVSTLPWPCSFLYIQFPSLYNKEIRDALLRVFLFWHSRMLSVSLTFRNFAARYIGHSFLFFYINYYIVPHTETVSGLAKPFVSALNNLGHHVFWVPMSAPLPLCKTVFHLLPGGQTASCFFLLLPQGLPRAGRPLPFLNLCFQHLMFKLLEWV